MVNRNVRRIASAGIVLALSGCASSTAGNRSWWSGWFGSSPPSAASAYVAGKQPSLWEKTTATVSSTFSGAAKSLSPAPSDSATDSISLAHKSAPSPEFHLSVARMQENSGNFDGAIEQYQKVLELSPQHPGALLGLALLHDRQQRFDEAIKYYQLAAEKHPNRAAVLNNLGLCASRQGKHAVASAALHEAIELQPTKALYRNNLASVLVSADRLDEAVATLTSIHGTAAANYNVAFLLQKQGRKDDAVRYFRRSLTADPALTAAQSWIDQLSEPDSQAVVAGASEAPPATPVAPPVQPHMVQPHVANVSDSAPQREAQPALGSAPTWEPTFPVQPSPARYAMEAPENAAASPLAPPAVSSVETPAFMPMPPTAFAPASPLAPLAQDDASPLPAAPSNSVLSLQESAPAPGTSPSPSAGHVAPKSQVEFSRVIQEPRPVSTSPEHEGLEQPQGVAPPTAIETVRRWQRPAPNDAPPAGAAPRLNIEGSRWQ